MVLLSFISNYKNSFSTYCLLFYFFNEQIFRVNVAEYNQIRSGTMVSMHWSPICLQKGKITNPQTLHMRYIPPFSGYLKATGLYIHLPIYFLTEVYIRAACGSWVDAVYSQNWLNYGRIYPQDWSAGSSRPLRCGGDVELKKDWSVFDAAVR